MEENGVDLLDLHPQLASFKKDVIDGLTGDPKALPWMYCYDAVGSELFEQQCQLPEYHIPRTEARLMDQIHQQLRSLAGPGANIIEFGSGSSIKIRRLLEQLDRPASVTSVDISKEHLFKATRALARHYPLTKMRAICADFTKFSIAPEQISSNGGRNLGFFPGSTLSNWDRVGGCQLLASMRAMLGSKGALLIGIDMLQETDLLLAAYSDKHGVSAAFCSNLLTRIRNELGAKVDVDAFVHEALVNKETLCVEEYLRSAEDQDIVIDGQRFELPKGEAILVHKSYKFTLPGFQAMAIEAGFELHKQWVDPKGWFSVHWLTVP